MNDLVTFGIFNYNYGQYLEECIDSALSQTHKNVEVVISDNASTDNSWEIANKFAKYNNVILIRNNANLGVANNYANCLYKCRGDYFVGLCSDDVLEKKYAERCVKIMREYRDLGFAMVNRSIIDEHGNLTYEPPFYDHDCIIPGEDQAAVYMMAAVNPSVSQVMYDTRKMVAETIITAANRWYAARMRDFSLCCKYPMAYLTEPLLRHRLHASNDSYKASKNLMEVIGPYVLQHEFADLARHYAMPRVEKRLPASLEKLAMQCLRYAARNLLENDNETADKYLHLAYAIWPGVIDVPDYMLMQTPRGRDSLCEELKKRGNDTSLITRKESYPPPSGALIL